MRCPMHTEAVQTGIFPVTPVRQNLELDGVDGVLARLLSATQTRQ